MKSKLSLASLLAPGCLLISGCDYEVPLTPAPTHQIDARLLGDWVAAGPDAKKEEQLQVRQWDDTTYAATIDGDVYRVYHSDFASTAFVSVQDLNSDARKYLFYRWSLSADGRHLTLQNVSTKVIPDTTKTGAALQKLIKQSLTNPKLFNDELHFTRKQPR